MIDGSLPTSYPRIPARCEVLKRIFTTGESATFRIAQQVASAREVEVHAKLRVADAILIDRSGISNEEYDYALKAHFDVLMVRNNLPILAIEGPDPGLFRFTILALCRRNGQVVDEALKPTPDVLDRHVLTFDIGGFVQALACTLG
jgi:hypothetical protein